ncbi:MAG: NAD(+) synthase [Flavobacteriales bacterium]
MNTKGVINHIETWLKSYLVKSGCKGFVVGVSGGIDSAVTSTLCARTGFPLIVVNIPIFQPSAQYERSKEHIAWLKSNFISVQEEEINLTDSFKSISVVLPQSVQDELTMANVRSRMRMLTLYAFAGHYRYLVVGTGNKVEDFGVGFFTKYGDGGVDLSPIADLSKTEVYILAKELGIVQSIQQAKPTDGLWDDDRSDEDQLGATYPELEWVMGFSGDESLLNEREREVLAIYRRLNKANKHKMIPIPVCHIPPELK